MARGRGQSLRTSQTKCALCTQGAEIKPKLGACKSLAFDSKAAIGAGVTQEPQRLGEGSVTRVPVAQGRTWPAGLSPGTAEAPSEGRTRPRPSGPGDKGPGIPGLTRSKKAQKTTRLPRAGVL